MTRLDIRWPLGLIFTIIGAILMVYGVLTPASPGVVGNINFIWGAVLALFGGAMLLLARRAFRMSQRV